APGDDKIPYSFFAHLSDSSLTYYLNLINSMCITCVIPESWKKQIILPILKPGKSSSDVLSYRPIALSSVMLKILEHLIKIRLDWFVESNSLLSDSQNGFRRGKSTMDNLATFIVDILVAFSHTES
ncbi:hypothetical protein F3G58_32440, partial [Pseudomonas aeruginosa]